MNNSFFNLFADRKRYNYLLELVEHKDFYTLDHEDRGDNFGLKTDKYFNLILDAIEQKIIEDPNIFIDMKNSNYSRIEYFAGRLFKANPNIIEKFINEGVYNLSYFTLIALENGYIPADEYINNHLSYFETSKIVLKLLEIGYRPTSEIIESNQRMFKDDEILSKLFEYGYVPSLNFIKQLNLLNNLNLRDKVFDMIELNSETINDNVFYGNPYIQQKVISKNPELLLELTTFSKAYVEFWIEAFKMGYIPDEILDKNSIKYNYTIFPRVIKHNPEMIKYSEINDDDKKNKLDDLALSMGYVPSISDAKSSKYIKNSAKLMRALIMRRPEAIKYVGSIEHEEFLDLARLALDNGYIPTLEDLEENEKLFDSFDIMKVLIQDNPELINKIKDKTSNKGDLLKIALENGFNGTIENSQLAITEEGIKYRIERGEKLNFGTGYNHFYSVNLYNYLIDKGLEIDKIVDLFTSNYEAMKAIIAIYPEYVNKVDISFSRIKIDELCSLAIEKGYEPKFEDEIFQHGIESAKIIVKKFPNYIEDNTFISFLKEAIPSDHWLEICRIALDGGYVPNINKMLNDDNHQTQRKYGCCYEIMKMVIPLKPELIESCDVADKEKYDELCRLAISYGYEITSEYGLNRWGKKMYTNFDLMSKYIAIHPDAVINVDIPNQEEMLKIIDIAIKAGFSFKDVNNNKLLNLFINIDESKWAEYLSEEQIDALKNVKNLYINNIDISETVKSKFLSENIIQHFTKNQVEILSCYPLLQEKIIELAKDSYKSSLIYELANKYKDNLEWIPILSKALDSVDSIEYHSLINSLRDIELSSEEKENLMYLLMTDNHLDISTIDELRNIDSIRENYIKVLIERNTLGSLKAAYLERAFGIDLTTAINLVTLYGKSLEGKAINSLSEESKSYLVILDNIKKIINMNNIDILRYYVENVNPNFIVKPDLMVTYEARLKYLFTKEFNNSFTQPLDEDKVVSNTNGENDFDIYLAAGRDGNKKCRMMITSIGAYTGMEEPDDYYASWNVERIESHGCCCSYVGEKNLGTAEVKYCCLGFTDYEPGSLQLSAPYDLSSYSQNDQFEVHARYSSMYMLPEDILDYTRHTHNETVWERRNISGDGTFKKQPSYIVYFVDNFEDRLSDPEAMRQWESVKKAASNFSIDENGIKRPLPIMVVEREKIAKSQIEIINNKLFEFKTTFSPSLISEIISDYESNYAGNKKFHLNISEKYFPQHEILSESVVGKIIGIINKLSDTNPDLATQCIYELEKAVKREHEKYNNNQQSLENSIPSFNIEEALISINELKSNFKMNIDSTLHIINNCENNCKQFERSDASNISPEILESQISSSDVESMLAESGLSATILKYENEIKNEKINSKLKVHGQRHIKNVLLYTSLIGNSLISDQHDLDLLMMAAKYHDVSRKTDAYEEHAKASSLLAAEELKDKCSKEDLAIIQTIIEFHEMPRNVTYEDSLFDDIVKRNGIPEDQIPRVRELAEILKDADALDRTRFINNARLNPEFLKYNISKQLIRFASSLQETYALQDLKEFHYDEQISILLEKYTPQEVLRTIRHSNRGNLRIEDIHDFIDSWVSSVTIENEEGVNYGK